MKRTLPVFPSAGYAERKPMALDSGRTDGSRLQLGAREVAVWRATLDERPADVVEYLQSLLSTEEVERAAAFRFERDRRSFVVGRGTLRVLLGGYLGRGPQKIALRYGAAGKPVLAPEENGTQPLFFNVTHSAGIALFAFTRISEIGVDLERIRELPEWQSIAEASFSPRQLERLWRCPADRRRDEFFRTWTQQEALLKAAGTGLGGAPRSVDGFKVYSLRVAPGFAAALAVTETAGTISIRANEYPAP